MFTNWNRKAKKETRLNPLSIDDIDALTIATLRGMGTTPQKFRENVKQDMPEDAMEQGNEIMRRNPKVQMPDSHFNLQGAQEQQMMDEMELDIPEFHFDEGAEDAKLGVKQMARDESTQRALNAYKNTYKDHVMQAFDKHKAFMQSLGNQPMTVQEFMQHPKVPSFADYYKQAREGTIPGGDYAEAHPFAMTHPKEYIQHRDGTGDTLPPPGMEGLFGVNNDPFIPVITGEPMDLALDVLLKQLELTPPMTQGVEEQMPMQEDIPTVDVTQDYDTDCECAERLRIMILQEINMEINQVRQGGYSDLSMAQLVDGYDDVEDMSCEEIIEAFPNMYQEECGNTNQGFSEADQMKYAGEPIDLAMDTLLKFQSAAQRRIYNEIPLAEEVGSIDDVVAMRNIPVHRLESGGMPAFNMPVPLRGTRPGDPLQFERDIHARGGVTIPDFTPDYQIPDDPRKEIQGTFVYPLDVSSFAPERFTSSGNPDFLSTGYPDMNRGIGDTVTLGILDKPEWRAGQAHGRSQPEGYQPMGFDKDAFVRLDGGLGVSAVGPREEWSALARRLSPAFEKPPVHDEVLDMLDYPALYRTLSKLPVTTTASKRNPLTGYKPTNIDFLLDRMGGARIVASEPMNLAMDALLKSELHPGPFSEEPHDYTMPTNLHPDWDKWVDEFMDDGIQDFEPLTQNDVNYLAESQSREEFLQRVNDITDFMRSDDMHPNAMRVDDYLDDYHFRDVPFNEETGFTRSEPMALAIDALLKRELHPGYPEDMSIEDMINAGHDYPFNKDKYPDEYLANYPEEHIEEYGERPFNPAEPFILEESDQPLHVGLSQRDIDAYREQMYRETLERMSAIDNSRDNESWAKWVASEAMPPAPQNSPLRMRRQVMVPVKNPDKNDIDALLDMPDETGATVVQSFAGIPMNEETGFTRSEPMDLTIDALLKGEQHNEWFKEYYENNPIKPFFSIKDHRYLNEAQNRDDYFDRMNKLSEFHKDENKTEPSTDIQFPAGFQFSNKSEPMDLAVDALLKDLSPEAKRHKLEYDKKYESSPERVKYREELNRERRRRGIYGSGDHMDVSHTEGGKLTLESEHDNRARHFKDKGTLRPSD